MTGAQVESGGLRLEYLRQIENAQYTNDQSSEGTLWLRLHQHSQDVANGLIDAPPLHADADIVGLRDYEFIHSRQVARYIMASFHTALDVSAEAFEASMPDIPPQPPEYAGFYDMPLIVVPEVPEDVQRQLIGLRSYIPNFTRTDRTPIPDAPYAIWTHPGKKVVKGKQPITEVDSPLVELLAHRLQYPGVYPGESIIAPGSTIIANLGRNRHDRQTERESGYPAVDVRYVTRASETSQRPRLTRGELLWKGTPLPRGRAAVGR